MRQQFDRSVTQLKNLYWSLRSDNRILYFPLLILRDPFSLTYVRTFLRSLLPGRSTLLEELPWITFKSIHWLNKTLHKEMHVFEYGSGGSTLFLANHVSAITSVEHNPHWYKILENMLLEKKISNVSYSLLEPKANSPVSAVDYSIDSCTSTKSAYKGMSFKDYVHSIDRFPDDSFDLVTVDGRARISCIKQAISKIKNGGYLLLDNSERPQYGPGISLLANYPRSDLSGTGPCSPKLWTTSVWKITK